MARAADAGASPEPFIVDTDAHYFEPLEEILKYVPEPWRRRMANRATYPVRFYLIPAA